MLYHVYIIHRHISVASATIGRVSNKSTEYTNNCRKCIIKTSRCRR